MELTLLGVNVYALANEERNAAKKKKKKKRERAKS